MDAAPHDIAAVPLLGKFVVVGNILAVVALAMGIIRAVVSGAAGACVRSLADLGHCSAAWLWHPAADDEVMLLVREKLKSQAVQNVRLLHVTLCFITIPNLHGAADAVSRPAVSDEELLTQLAFALNQLFFSCCFLCPWIVTERTLDLSCGLPILVMALMGQPWLTGIEVQEAQAKIFGRGMVLVVLTVFARRTTRTRMRTFFFGCILTYGLAVLSSARSARPANGLMKDNMSGLFLVTMLSVFLAWLLEKAFENLMIRNLQMEDAKQLHAATSALLSTCCDVVVELDAEGRLASDARNMSSFLLRDGARLEGVPFADLLVGQDDQSTFRERLMAEQGEGSASTMHVQVRDGSNNMLRLEALWFKFRRLNGRTNVILGLREHQPGPALPIPLSRGQAEPDSAQAESTDESDGGHSSPHVDVVNENSLPETCSVGSDVASGALRDTVAKAVVDTTRPGIPVLTLTTGFTTQIGRLPRESNLMEHLRFPNAFRPWLRRALWLARQDPHGQHETEVVLDLPNGCDSARAVCSLELERGEQVNQARVTLSFRDVKKRRRNASRRGGRRSRRELPAVGGTQFAHLAL